MALVAFYMLIIYYCFHFFLFNHPRVLRLLRLFEASFWNLWNKFLHATCSSCHSVSKVIWCVKPHFNNKIHQF